MKFRCPCEQGEQINLTPLKDEQYVSTYHCPYCGRYASIFRDRLGVTYVSHSLAAIQEMRDEEKEARGKSKSRGINSNKRSRARKVIKTSKADRQHREVFNPTFWPDFE